MKYKLIDKQSNEHLCDKVTIDGFDYYITEEAFEVGEVNVPSDFNKVSDLSITDISDLDVVNDKYNGYKKLIATNNPYLNVPQIVDEKKVDWDLLYQQNGIAFQGESKKLLFRKGYIQSQNTHPFNAEDMIDFAKWRLTYEKKYPNNNTTKKLLDIWVRSKIIIIK